MAFALTAGSIALTVAGQSFFTTMKAVRGVLSGTHDQIQDVTRASKKMFVVGSAYVSASLLAYGSFEKAMRRATAVSDATEKQFEEMSLMAEKQSIRLNIAATRAADAFYYLGSAGLSVTDQIKAYTAVATLAKAATIDMGSSAEMIVDTMKGFKIGFEHTAYVTDVLAKAVISSNMTFAQLGETLSYVAGVSRTAGNNLAETVAVIATMADVGIKGTRAGTTLRRSLLNMMAPLSSMRKELEKYNIQVYDAAGRMKPFIQLVGEMTHQLRYATEAQKNMAFKVLFGARAIAGQIAVFDKGEASLRDFTDMLEDAGGAAQMVASKQMRAFGERIGQLWQRTKRLARTVGDMLAPAFLYVGKSIGETTDRLDEFLERNKIRVQKWGEVVAARVIMVKNIFVEFVKYIATDWRRNLKIAFLASLKIFLAFANAAKRVLRTIWDAFVAYGFVAMKRMFAMMADWQSRIKLLTTKHFALGFVERVGGIGIPKAMQRAMVESAQISIEQQKKGKYAKMFPYGEYNFKPEMIKLWRGIVDDFAEAGKGIAKMLPMVTNEAIRKEMARSAREIAAIRLKYETKINEAAVAAGRPPRLPRPFAEMPRPMAAEPRVVTGIVGLSEAWSQLALSLKPKEDLEQQQLDLQREAVKESKMAVQLLRNTRDGILDLPEQLAALQGGALRLTA